MSRGRPATLPPVTKGEETAPDGPHARPGAHLRAERLQSRAKTGGVDGGHLQQRVDGTARKRALANECQPGGWPPIIEPDQRFVVPTAVNRPDLQCYGHLAPTRRPQPSPPRPSPFIFEHTRALESKRYVFLWAFCWYVFSPSAVLFLYQRRRREKKQLKDGQMSWNRRFR